MFGNKKQPAKKAAPVKKTAAKKTTTRKTTPRQSGTIVHKPGAARKSNPVTVEDLRAWAGRREQLVDAYENGPEDQAGKAWKALYEHDKTNVQAGDARRWTARARNPRLG